MKILDNDGTEIKYIKYLKRSDMIMIDRGNGIELIPASGYQKIKPKFLEKILTFFNK